MFQSLKWTILLKSTISKNVSKEKQVMTQQVNLSIVSQISCLSNPHFRIKIHSGFKVTGHFLIELIPSLTDWLLSRKYFGQSAISIVIVYDWTFSTHHLIHCNKYVTIGELWPLFYKVVVEYWFKKCPSHLK